MPARLSRLRSPSPSMVKPRTIRKIVPPRLNSAQGLVRLVLVVANICPSSGMLLVAMAVVSETITHTSPPT